MDAHMTLPLPGPTTDPAELPSIDLRRGPAPGTVDEARRLVEGLEEVRAQLVTTRRALDRFVEAAEERLGVAA